jgi:hypothetical protein
MAIQTPALRETLADAYGAEALYGAVYTSTPGVTAGTEPTGGTPAYARKSLTWSAASTSGGVTTITATAVFDVPASTTVVGVGVHDAATAGNYLDGGTITSQAFASQGTLTVTFTYTQS